MKFLAAMLLGLLLVGCGAQDSPDIRAQTAIDALRGQWVVINYWARWCKPCVKEIPELNKLDQKHATVTVLGVNYDGATGDELASQMTEFGVEFANLDADPAAHLGIPRPVVLPTTVILDPKGTVIQTLVGPQTLEALEAATIGG